MTLSLIFCNSLRHIPDAIWTADGCSAIFLNNQCHDLAYVLFLKMARILTELVTKTNTAVAEIGASVLC
jgi:hypothetical protein